jgi:hypothetical protein
VSNVSRKHSEEALEVEDGQTLNWRAEEVIGANRRSMKRRG